MQITKLLAQPFSAAELRTLFEYTSALQRLLLSFFLHAGLSPEMLVNLSEDALDRRGWLNTHMGWRPLPDRTLAGIIAWQRDAGTERTHLLPRWRRTAEIQMDLVKISTHCVVNFTVARAQETLARALYMSSEDSRWMYYDEPAQDWEAIPLQVFFPFSVLNFESTTDAQAERARLVLNRASALIS